MNDYKVYFVDGNQKIFSAVGMYDLISYLCFRENWLQNAIWKIEKIEEKC